MYWDFTRRITRHNQRYTWGTLFENAITTKYGCEKTSHLEVHYLTQIMSNLSAVLDNEILIRGVVKTIAESGVT